MVYNLTHIKNDFYARSYLLLFGCSYKTAPISLREKFYFLLKEYEKKENLLKLFDCTEYSSIITCNRCEVVLVTNKPSDTIKFVEGFLEENGFEKSSFYFYWDRDVLRHMLYVSCGLDSESLFEEEIRYQLRKIGINSRMQGISRKVLPFLFDFCYNSSGRIRKKFNIEGKSLASIVVKKICQMEKPKKILLIGSGKTIASAVKELHAEELYVYTKRSELPSYLAYAKRIKEDEIKEILSYCDLVISATISGKYILRKEHIAKKIIILDFGFPRNIDPSISEYLGCKLINIDDMIHYIDNVQDKVKEINEEIEKEIGTFYKTIYYSKLDHTIPFIYIWAENIREKELNKAINEIKAGKDLFNVLDLFSKSLVSKLLQPILSFSKKNEENSQLIRRIFSEVLNEEN